MYRPKHLARRAETPPQRGVTIHSTPRHRRAMPSDEHIGTLVHTGQIACSCGEFISADYALTSSAIVEFDGHRTLVDELAEVDD